MTGTTGCCPGCGTNTYLIPLHGNRGGPLRCPLCVGKWNAKHTRRRKWGRVIVKALRMYFNEGGRRSDVDQLCLAASGLGDLATAFGKGAWYRVDDDAGADVPDITSELLADVLQLTHPDRHPEERRALAQRVTQDLLALRPFVFPAPAPKPLVPSNRTTSDSCNGSANVRGETPKKPYPCELCCDTVPRFYCSECESEWTKRRTEKRERHNAKQRRYYALRRDRLNARKPRWQCLACGGQVTSTRKDAKYCSNRCRQLAHRQRGVTLPSHLGGAKRTSCNASSAVRP